MIDIFILIGIVLVLAVMLFIINLKKNYDKDIFSLIDDNSSYYCDAVLENSKCGICIIDINKGTVIKINNKFREILSEEDEIDFPQIFAEYYKENPYKKYNNSKNKVSEIVIDINEIKDGVSIISIEEDKHEKIDYSKKETNDTIEVEKEEKYTNSFKMDEKKYLSIKVDESLVRLTNSCVFDLDIDYKLELTDSFHILLKYAHNEIKSFGDLLEKVHFEDREYFEKNIENIVERKIEKSFIFRMKNASNIYLTLRAVSISKKFDTRGKFPVSVLLVDYSQEFMWKNQYEMNESLLVESEEIGKTAHFKYIPSDNTLHISESFSKIHSSFASRKIIEYSEYLNSIVESEREFVDMKFKKSIWKNDSFDVIYTIASEENVKFVRAISRSYYNEDGSISHAVGNLADITESQEYEYKLTESKKLLTSIIKQSPIGIIVSDENGCFNLINNKALEFLDLKDTANISIKDVFKQLISCEDSKGNSVPIDEFPLSKSINENTSIEKICKIESSNNNIRWINFSSTPLFNNENEFIGAILVCSDLTKDRKNQEEIEKKTEELYKSEKQKTTIINSVSEAIIYYDCSENNESCTVKYCNDVFYSQNFGKERVFDGCNYPDKLCENHHNSSTCIIQKTRDSRVPMIEEIIIGKRDIEIHTSPVFNYDGEIEGVVEMRRDVTITKKEAKEREFSEQLFTLNKLVNQITDEFNGKLMSLLGCTETILAKNNIDLEIKKYGNDILSNVNEMIAMNNAIKTFDDKLEFSREWIEVSDVLKELIDTGKSGINKEIDMIFDYENLSRKIFVNKDLMIRVVEIVIKNAVESINTSGEIRINTSVIDEDTENEMLEIYINDTGEGIPTEIIDKITEPVFTTKGKKHFGMGLPQAIYIINKFEGEFHVLSKVGVGTTVKITLPSKSSLNFIDKDSEIIKTLEKTRCKPADKRILIVEDEEIIRNLIGKALKNRGFNIVLASDGVDAIKQFSLEAKTFDLIIMDMIMPEMDGVETLERIKDIRTDIKVVVLSAYNQREDNLKIEEIGVVDFLKKPISMKKLTQKICEILNVRD